MERTVITYSRQNEGESLVSVTGDDLGVILCKGLTTEEKRTENIVLWISLIRHRYFKLP